MSEKSLFRCLKVSIFSFLFVGFLFANTNQSSLSIEQKQYTKDYINAINSNSLDKLKLLSHPKYLDCINPSNKDYYDSTFQKSLKKKIPKEYKISFEKLSKDIVNKEVGGAKTIGLIYVLNPTHRLQIDYEKSEYSFVTIIRNLVYENGKYFEISACPSLKMVKKFREMKVKKEKFRKEAKLLFSKLEDPLLSQLRELLKNGQRIKAWKKYSEVSGQSLSMSKEVLSHIKTNK